jgi:hypothetical protein
VVGSKHGGAGNCVEKDRMNHSALGINVEGQKDYIDYEESAANSHHWTATKDTSNRNAASSRNLIKNSYTGAQG